MQKVYHSGDVIAGGSWRSIEFTVGISRSISFVNIPEINCYREYLQVFTPPELIDHAITLIDKNLDKRKFN
jgi:hypothetical protein